ncbi:hypothetical protein BH24ACT3_BH24ACT3_07920 [soil metagenome]
MLRDVLATAGVDADAVFTEVAAGGPLGVVRKEHEQAVTEHDVWGVPTFLVGAHAAFVRLMDRPEGDTVHARRSIDRVLDLLTDAPTLNEFKHTTLER